MRGVWGGCALAVSASSLVFVVVGDVVGNPSGDSPADVGVGGSEGLLNRAAPNAGDLLDGTVLLLWTPMVGVVAASGVAYGELVELGAPFDCLECFDETETFLRIPPYLRTSSAPALPFDGERPTLDFDRPCNGVVGVEGRGVPAWTSRIVLSSAAVPVIPMRK